MLKYALGGIQNLCFPSIEAVKVVILAMAESLILNECSKIKEAHRNRSRP